jgi:hypothetical protein
MNGRSRGFSLGSSSNCFHPQTTLVYTHKIESSISQIVFHGANLISSIPIHTVYMSKPVPWAADLIQAEHQGKRKRGSMRRSLKDKVKPIQRSSREMHFIAICVLHSYTYYYMRPALASHPVRENIAFYVHVGHGGIHHSNRLSIKSCRRCMRSEWINKLRLFLPALQCDVLRNPPPWCILFYTSAFNRRRGL